MEPPKYEEVLDPRFGWHLLGESIGMVFYKEKEVIELGQADVEGMPIPVQKELLVQQAEDEQIQRALIMQGYVGAEYEGHDPETGNMYYFIPESRVRVVFVPTERRFYSI